MNIRKITFFINLCLLPGLSTAELITQFYTLTDNSYYSSISTGKSILNGLLKVTIDDINFTANIDYSTVLLNGSSFFRPIDTLTTDVTGINSSALISGWYGDPDYINYGNATLSPLPFICVECGYEMTLNLTANPLILSYHESNPFDTGEVNFELYVSQVPLPTSAWLFGSGLIGLLGLSKRKRT
jgi:hypothetical protein